MSFFSINEPLSFSSFCISRIRIPIPLCCHFYVTHQAIRVIFHVPEREEASCRFSKPFFCTHVLAYYHSITAQNSVLKAKLDAKIWLDLCSSWVTTDSTVCSRCRGLVIVSLQTDLHCDSSAFHFAALETALLTLSSDWKMRCVVRHTQDKCILLPT